MPARAPAVVGVGGAVPVLEPGGVGGAWGCSGWAGGELSVSLMLLEGAPGPATHCLHPKSLHRRGPGSELGTGSQEGTTFSCHLLQEAFPDLHIGPGPSSEPPEPPKLSSHRLATPCGIFCGCFVSPSSLCTPWGHLMLEPATGPATGLPQRCQGDSGLTKVQGNLLRQPPPPQKSSHWTL